MVRAAAADCAGSEASSLTLRTILAPRTPPALLIWSTASCMPFLLWTPTRIPAPVTERSAPSLIVLPAYELVAPPLPPLVSQATTMTAATNAETRPNRFTSTVFHVRQTSRLEPFPLLLIGDVKADLEELDALVRDLSLEAVDELVTTLDDIERGEIVDPHDQHVLVMRAVEDADVSREGQASSTALITRTC